MTEQVNARQALLQDDVADQGLILTVGWLHIHEGYFVEDRPEALDLNPDWTADFCRYHFLSSRLNFDVVPDASWPSRPFQALGNTIKDAPVSTRASHSSAWEKSEPFSILTEAIILPMFLVRVILYTTIHLVRRRDETLRIVRA